MVAEEIRFGPADHIVFLLIRRTRSAECTTMSGLERYAEWDALCVFDDPSVAGYVADLLNDGYSSGGAGEDYPGGAATCTVFGLTDREQLRAYEDLNDGREWKDEIRQRALEYADVHRTANSRAAEDAPGKSKEDHPAGVARSSSENVSPTSNRAVDSEHDNYKPAGWFAQHTDIPSPRLRKAARPERKRKKVRMRVIDGRPHYHAGDVERWWESDFQKAHLS